MKVSLQHLWNGEYDLAVHQGEASLSSTHPIPPVSLHGRTDRIRELCMKRPSLIQALFGRMSTEVDVGMIVESTNVHYKLRVLMKKRICRG